MDKLRTGQEIEVVELLRTVQNGEPCIHAGPGGDRNPSAIARVPFQFSSAQFS